MKFDEVKVGLLTEVHCSVIHSWAGVFASPRFLVS